MVPHHHVVLDHAEPLRLVPVRALQLLHAARRRRWRRGGHPPRRSTARIGSITSVVTSGHAEDARELHHERRARSVVVRGLAVADAVHVRADDVHLAAARRAPLRAVDHWTGPGMTGPRFNSRSFTFGCRSGSLLTPVRAPKPLPPAPRRNGIVRRAPAGTAREAPLCRCRRHRRRRLRGSARQPAAPPPAAPRTAAPARAAPPRCCLRRQPARIRRVVRHALGLAAIALELRLDPVDRVAIALRAFAAIAKLGQALDRGLVPLEFQPADEHPDRVGARPAPARLAARRPALPRSPRPFRPPSPAATRIDRRIAIACSSSSRPGASVTGQ